MKYQILQGDNRETLKTIPDNSIDAIVTDPPYGIDFLGKSWDANTGAVETYAECLRVLKPGGHILAFSAARTYHHLAVTLEQAGFEIRDQIMWIYSSGFPKSQDVGRSIQRSLGVKETKLGNPNRRIKKNDTPNTYDHGGLKETITGDVVCTDPEAQRWEGWGTNLKPAHEPIALARKPIKLSIARNCQVHGVGALNIDATRIEGLTEKELNWTPQRQQAGDTTEIGTFGASGLIGQEVSMFNDKGRFPSNVIGEIPDYQKYFYCPKVSRRERHVGHDLPPAMFGDKKGAYDDNGERYAVGLDARTGPVGNNHPTVKPIELMKYLIRLITPPGGVVLDPFNGSGSTGCAAVELGHPYIGCELDSKYVEIAEKRIAAWNRDTTTFGELFE